MRRASGAKRVGASVRTTRSVRAAASPRLIALALPDRDGSSSTLRWHRRPVATDLAMSEVLSEDAESTTMMESRSIG